MKDFQIFSDSSCDIPESLIQEHNIRIIPYYVTFDKKNYLKEHDEITNEDYYKKLLEKHVYPKTSLPSVQDYIDAFQEAIEQGKDIFCFCLTAKFSGSYQSAINAKNILEEENEYVKIVIIDSIQATAGQGLVVLQAAYMKEMGMDMAAIETKTNKIKNTARIMFTVDTLDYLQKGGRIGKVTSLAGTMLNLKPMIVLKDKELQPYSNVRGRKKALDKILLMVEEYFETNGEKYDDYDFCIANATTVEDTLRVQERTEMLIGRKINYPFFQIGVTIGTYTGPGAVGVCFIKKYNA